MTSIVFSRSIRDEADTADANLPTRDEDRLFAVPLDSELCRQINQINREDH